MPNTLSRPSLRSVWPHNQISEIDVPHTGRSAANRIARHLSEAASGVHERKEKVECVATRLVSSAINQPTKHFWLRPDLSGKPIILEMLESLEPWELSASDIEDLASDAAEDAVSLEELHGFPLPKRRPRG